MYRRATRISINELTRAIWVRKERVDLKYKWVANNNDRIAKWI